MICTKSVGEFMDQNQEELQKLVSSICYRYKITCVDDVIQDVYFKFLTKNTLKKFKPSYSIKISTYLYRVIQNMILAYIATNQQQIERRKLRLNLPKIYNSNDNEYIDEVGMAFSVGLVDINYLSMLEQNHISGKNDLSFDLNIFDSFLAKRNKVYHLSRRKNKKIKSRSLSLLTVYRLLRSGQTSREIAEKYGVSDMFISTLKGQIKRLLIKFGVTQN